ncbi:hypothetical protein like AT3G43110 [Hibiscus trionum]|uniref:Uncharacterized protein n=1 Tax=Hibiscus trionum TaxID=183268 RepID=A0A9W7M4E5_HIBTR|nr:hypothetical protein like AT3G43110 [Hibiscus trionum]
MKQSLDSPFEALTFNYVSFGVSTVINNVWTWVAVVTAATISFWRIRAVCAVASSCSVTKLDLNLLSMSISDYFRNESRPILEVETKSPPPSTSVSAPKTYSSQSVYNNVASTKGVKLKLTDYYDGGSDGNDKKMTVTKSCYGEWWESWERVLRVRKGECGRYRYQDLTIVNGNVVRLWDDKTCKGYRRQ